MEPEKELAFWKSYINYMDGGMRKGMALMFALHDVDCSLTHNVENTPADAGVSDDNIPAFYKAVGIVGMP